LSGKAGADQLPTVFSAGREGAWAIFRFGKEYPQLMPGMRFPVAAQAEFWFGAIEGREINDNSLRPGSDQN
jgi:hypothetical protein